VAQVASGSEGTVAKVIDSDNLPYGYAVTNSGRISGVTEPGELSVHYPFAVKDLVVRPRWASRLLPRRSRKATSSTA
jgi:hypothetical protein